MPWYVTYEKSYTLILTGSTDCSSQSQYFAQCVNPNETWLPLLEKAYAKAHGDYSAIEGGYGGEGIEDLTGGVTSEIYTTDILDKEHFWNEELMKVNQDFLFGCSTGVWGRGWGERKGIVELHAYSVLKAREIDGVRLVLLKNPWGKHEWRGPWSDGSSKCCVHDHLPLYFSHSLPLATSTLLTYLTEEWTAEWLQKLDHKFGDDGSFWISYDDLLRKYQAFDRTRLFSPQWKVASIWTTLDVSWTVDYHDTKFAFSLYKSGPVVIVFSQLDERYFKGLEGQYRFELSFRVHKAGEEDYVVRSQNYYRMNRSVNVELDLEAGEYVVVVKVDAQRNERIMPVEEVVRAHARERREKLLRIGQAYDLAHAKGRIVETAEEKQAREAYETRRREKERKKMVNFMQENKVARRKAMLRRKIRDRKRKEKEEAKEKARTERKAARREARAKAKGEEEEDEEKKKKKKKKVESGAVATEVASEGTRDEKESSKEGGTPAKVTTDAVDDKAGQDQPDVKFQIKEGSEQPQKEESGTQSTTEEKPVKIEAAPDAESQGEGSAASTEPGDGVHTPTSSTRSSKRSAQCEDADIQDDEAYVTAAEESFEKLSLSVEEPSTPKPTKPTIPPRTHSVDVGVQTGPGLPISPPMYPPQPRHEPPPHHYMRSMLSHHPPPPPPGAQYARVPPRNLSHIPPDLRAVYGGHEGPPGQGRYVGPPVSETELTSDSSDSCLDENNMDAISEISEGEIDVFIAENQARAVRAASVAAAKVPPPSGSTMAVEEPLDDFEKDPWNAVGVFGLRVYYKVPEESGLAQATEVVRLRVERPSPYLWDESSDEEADDEKEEDKKEESQVLDVDDSAKDAVGETPPTPGVELLKQLMKEDKRDGDGDGNGQEVIGCEEAKKESAEPSIKDHKLSDNFPGAIETEKQ